MRNRILILFWVVKQKCNFVSLEVFVDPIAAQPHMAAFLPRRYGLPDAAYVAHAKSIVLGS